MRIVREQMLCIISADWPNGADMLSSPALAASLRDLFADLGVVHFASLALLPARSGAGSAALPSLLLEIAVDEGVRPFDVLTRLAFHPDGALWKVYQAYWPVESPASVGLRNNALLARLIAGLSVADGAFVGPRDRTVSQILQERRLYETTREVADDVAAKQTGERRTFALALARWAMQHPRFEWAANPAPRSFWGGSAATLKAKFGYIGLVVSLVFGVLWLLLKIVNFGQASRDAGVTPLPASLHGILLAVFDGLINFLTAVLGGGLRLLAVAFVSVVLFWVVFAGLPAIFNPWRRWLKAVERELDRPTQTWSSRLTCVCGWFVAIALLMPLTVTVQYVVCGTLPSIHEVEWQVLHMPEWLVGGVVLGAGLLGAICAVLILMSWREPALLPNAAPTPLRRRFDILKRWFFRPFEDETPRAHQIHESIEKCEASLVNSTSHMISLTDLRRPYAWSAWWTKLVIRATTLLGHVFFTEGRLGNIPGIQFAHWHIVDGGKRFLFCANFDGTFGGYLDDFINGGSGGTTLFWRWTTLRSRTAACAGHPAIADARRFPPTRFLLFRGVKCELTFKAYARDSMLPHLFRFDACNLTVEEKNRATHLRDALFGERTDAKDDQIMRALET